MEVFESARIKKQYRNMVDDPYLAALDRRNSYNDFCGCGALAASGGGEPVQSTDEPETTVTKEVQNLQFWQYAKMALALVGAYVVVKYLYGKFK